MSSSASEMGTPFDVGEKVFICTDTLYFVGRVKTIGFGWVTLTEASWVHWTGRLSSLMASQDFNQTHGSRKARTELVGTVTLYIQSFVCHYPWEGNLPTESIQ